MLEEFHWHFQAVQWQNQAYEDALHNLGQDEVLWHFDFKQNVSIPQGQREGGSWWYANARLEYTVFGLMEAKGSDRCYHTWISDVLEKGSTLAIAMMSELIAGLPATVRKITLWGDCGPHFRSYQFAYWAMVELRQAAVRALRVEDKSISVELSFFAEHHGKGIVDGHFGLLARWLREYCMTRVASSKEDLVAAFNEGAAKAKADNPSGPVYSHKIFQEPRKPKVHRALSRDGGCAMRITKTYSMEIKPAFLANVPCSNKPHVHDIMKLHHWRWDCAAVPLYPAP